MARAQGFLPDLLPADADVHTNLPDVLPPNARNPTPSLEALSEDELQILQESVSKDAFLSVPSLFLG